MNTSITFAALFRKSLHAVNTAVRRAAGRLSCTLRTNGARGGTHTSVAAAYTYKYNLHNVRRC